MFKQGTSALIGAALVAAALMPATASANIEDIQLVNTDPWNRTVWITITPEDGGTKDQKKAFCLKPREVRKYSVDMTTKWGATPPTSYRIRGEVTRNADCQQPVDCDTYKVVKIGGPGSKIFRFETDPKKCYWLEHVDTQGR